MWITRNKLEEIINERLLDVLKDVVLGIDPGKHYILIVPLSVDEDALHKAFKDFHQTNLVILRADSAKLLEL